ncbi:MAG: 23S rRNA (guanosine(2251)-2'-O)-methyltransferase RlmB [Rhodospirillales bacterium]|nr:23S rRNA (guanosine(2251)-2'-O)-methyltransferase RlmB [Rhodospirillales bacterium]
MAKRKPPRSQPGKSRAGPNRPPDQPPGRFPGRFPNRHRRDAPAKAPVGHGPAGGIWLYGTHAVRAALANPRRRIHRLLISPEAAKREGQDLRARLAARRDGLAPEAVARESFAEILPGDAVHQGLALQVEPLAQPDLEALLEGLPDAAADTGSDGFQVLVALDQVTDPHNVGAILRSAAAFGALAVLVPRNHAAPETGVLAKAASGALEYLPYIEAANLARALVQLKESGFWVLGLAAEAAEPLAAAPTGGRLVLVLGAEGSGLRRLTREHCDLLLRLPTRGPIGQLNVSNAAAVALYELLGRRRA